MFSPMIFNNYEFFSRQFTRDEKYYPEPESFNPNRFLRNVGLGEGSHNPLKIVFGFGRRYAFHIICLPLSMMTSWIVKEFARVNLWSKQECG